MKKKDGVWDFTIFLDNFIISDTLVFLTAICAGSFIGRSFSDEALAQTLIDFLIISSVMDVVSFTGGLTNLIIENRGTLLQNLSIAFPIGSKIIPIMGIGDLIIIGILFQSLSRLGYRSVETYLVPTTGLMLALFVGLLLGGNYALPVMALTTIGNLLEKKFYDEKKKLL